MHVAQVAQGSGLGRFVMALPGAVQRPAGEVGCPVWFVQPGIQPGQPQVGLALDPAVPTDTGGESKRPGHLFDRTERSGQVGQHHTDPHQDQRPEPWIAGLFGMLQRGGELLQRSWVVIAPVPHHPRRTQRQGQTVLVTGEFGEPDRCLGRLAGTGQQPDRRTVLRQRRGHGNPFGIVARTGQSTGQ